MEKEGEIVCCRIDCDFKRFVMLPLDFVTERDKKQLLDIYSEINKLVNSHHLETATIIEKQQRLIGHSLFDVYLNESQEQIGTISGHGNHWEFEHKDFRVIFEKIRDDFDKEMRNHTEKGYYNDFRD